MDWFRIAYLFMNYAHIVFILVHLMPKTSRSGDQDVTWYEFQVLSCYCCITRFVNALKIALESPLIVSFFGPNCESQVNLLEISLAVLNT